MAAAGLVVQLLVVATAFRVLRMIGLVGITITGIVYHVAIAKLVEFDGWALVADQLTHTVVPVMAVAGWLMCGPRGQCSWVVVRLVLLYPLAYIAFTLVRGRIVDFYPYHFIDVPALGYGRWPRAASGSRSSSWRRPPATADRRQAGARPGPLSRGALQVRMRAATCGVQPRSSISTAWCRSAALVAMRSATRNG